MPKSFWRTVAFMIGGAILGTICGQLLAHQSPLLRQHINLQWNPSADVSFIRFSMDVTIRANLLSAVGAIIGYFASRRVK